MTFNPITFTIFRHVNVEDRDNKPHRVGYSLVLRGGATRGMIDETVRHFEFTANVCASDVGWHDSEKFQAASTRTEYPEATHGEPMVQIFCNDFPVWNDGRLHAISLNIFHEHTSAFQAYEQAMLAVQYVQAPAVPVSASPQPKEHPHVAPDGSTDLDAWFPPKQEAETDSAPPPPPKAQHENGEPVIEEWSNMQRETYEQQYMGQVVRVAITKLQRVFWTNKDKTKSGECVEVYGVYNGSESNKTAYALRTFISDADTAWDWKKYRDHPVIGQLLQNPGDTCTARGYLRFKINTGKNGNVYWNLYGIELAEQPKEFDEQDTVPEGDIPF